MQSFKYIIDLKNDLSSIAGYERFHEEVLKNLKAAETELIEIFSAGTRLSALRRMA